MEQETLEDSLRWYRATFRFCLDLRAAMPV